jgi:hypothetical protein
VEYIYDDGVSFASANCTITYSEYTIFQGHIVDVVSPEEYIEEADQLAIHLYMKGLQGR